MRYYHILLSLTILMYPLIASSQLIPVSAMKEDLEVFEEQLFELHIDIDRYFPESEIREEFDQIEKELNESLHSVDFYRKLLPLLPLIANGHTEISPPLSYYDSLRSKTLRFPFDLYREEDGFYVIRDMSADSLIGTGNELLEINGREVKDIVQEMVDNITRDGYNESLPRHSAVSSFKSYYAFHYGCPSEFEIEYEDDQGELRRAIVPGETLKRIAERRKERYSNMRKSWNDDEYKAYRIEYNKDIAIMKLNTFGKKYIKKTDGRSYKKFFKRAFREIDDRGVDKLIIDMRYNSGGDPEPTIELFAFMYPEPFVFYRSMTTKINRFRNSKLYDDDFFLINLLSGFMTKKRDDGLYDLKTVPGLKESKPKEPNYTGEVYVLISPVSFSATGEMTGILKEYDRVTFIGEEPGGNPYNNVSGYMPKLVLPNSKVRVSIPIVRFEMNISFDPEGRGVIPDHQVRPSVQDIIKGRDTVMEYTLLLIQNSN